MTSDRDPREAAADSYGSFNEAVAEMRRRAVRSGKYEPRPDNAEEMELHRLWQREREEKEMGW